MNRFITRIAYLVCDKIYILEQINVILSQYWSQSTPNLGRATHSLKICDLVTETPKSPWIDSIGHFPSFKERNMKIGIKYRSRLRNFRQRENNSIMFYILRDSKHFDFLRIDVIFNDILGKHKSIWNKSQFWKVNIFILYLVYLYQTDNWKTGEFFQCLGENIDK